MFFIEEEKHIAFSYVVKLYQSRIVAQFSFVFRDFNTEEYRPILCSNVIINTNSSDVSSWLCSDYAFFSKKFQ